MNKNNAVVDRAAVVGLAELDQTGVVGEVFITAFLDLLKSFGASFEAYEECWRRLRQHVRRIAPSVREALRARRLS